MASGRSDCLCVIARCMVVVVYALLVSANVFRRGVCSSFDFPDSLGG